MFENQELPLNDSFGRSNEIVTKDNPHEHSFFRNLNQAINEQNSYDPVMNFNLNDNNEIKAKGGEDKFSNNNYENMKMMSTKSSLKDASFTNTIQGSNSDLLFSGYFGQRHDQNNFNDNHFMSKNDKAINPFPTIEEEKTHKNKSFLSNDSFLPCSKRQRLDHGKDRFNGTSFFNTSTSSNFNKSTTFNKTSTSFNDLVKSVSLSSFDHSSNYSNPKKKSKKLFLTLGILSSEELEIEKIKKEKEELRRLKQLNQHNAEKVY